MAQSGPQGEPDVSNVPDEPLVVGSSRPPPFAVSDHTRRRDLRFEAARSFDLCVSVDVLLNGRYDAPTGLREDLLTGYVRLNAQVQRRW